MDDEGYHNQLQQISKPGNLYFVGLAVFMALAAALSVWAFIVLAANK